MLRITLKTFIHNSPYRYTTVFLGFGGIVLSILFDILSNNINKFGILQLSCMVVSTIFALAGIRKIFFPKYGGIDCILLLAYLCGILFMGLKNASAYIRNTDGILLVFWPPASDLIVNIIGFIPLSYLMMSLGMYSSHQKKGLFAVMIITFIGFLLSLSIEVMQGYIPGRTSSIVDVIANSFGIFIGIFYYSIEDKFLLSKKLSSLTHSLKLIRVSYS